MHKNFFLFEQILKEIKPVLLGSRITEAFTYQKDELVLRLNIDHFLNISVSPDHPYFLLSAEHKIKQPALTLFPELNGQAILNIFLKAPDKHLVIELENFYLEAVFYGTFFNVFLVDRQGGLVARFKEKGEPLPPRPAGDASQKLLLSQLEENALRSILKPDAGQSLLAFFKKNFAALNNLLLKEIFFRLRLSPDESLADLSPEQQAALIHTLLQMRDEVNAGKAYLYFQNEQAEKIGVLRLQHFEAANRVMFKEYDSVNTALSIFYSERTFRQEFLRLQEMCRKALDNRLAYLERSLTHLAQNANLEERKKEAELKGNLLLTFKHQIPKGSKEVELENIFDGSGEKVKIKLNPAKSVTANAERYFNKFKHLSEEKRLLEMKRDTYEKERQEIKQLLAELEKIKDIHRLRKFARKLQDLKLLQKLPETKKEKINVHHLKYSFNRIIVDKAWDVYIGKDGENNELLTFRFANKWDIWLHAQGVPGSHVIIRVPKRDQMPPHHVLEQAAQIAAAHSKAKHSSTVPVMYTQVRYVSRVRKAPPGTVKVKNEKLLFVKPMKLK